MIDPKWIALILLIVQNSGLALMMRFTMISTVKLNDRYLSSTAVLLAELIKFVISTLACFAFDTGYDVEKFTAIVHDELLGNRQDWIMLTVPSMLYTLQNLLQYYRYIHIYVFVSKCFKVSYMHVCMF